MTDPAAQTTSVLTTGDQGQCHACSAPVAGDQRYCLSCGARQGSSRVPFAELLPRAGQAATAGGPSAAGTSAEPPLRDWTPVLALGGLAVLALVLVAGVLIGRGSNNSPKVAASPQVITVAGGAAAAPAAAAPSTANASATSITEDWPAGKSAYTIELQAIPKSGATSDSVTAAKTAATGKGATGVGVLDASNYKGLGSDYVIYSGNFPTQAKANADLGQLKKAFPAAKVIHVVPSGGASAASAPGPPVSAAQAAQGASAINSLNNCSGAACSKAAAKVTHPVATSGAPAPKDNSKAAGGGSSAQTIG
jgi:hypothetical protein